MLFLYCCFFFFSLVLWWHPWIHLLGKRLFIRSQFKHHLFLKLTEFLYRLLKDKPSRFRGGMRSLFLPPWNKLDSQIMEKHRQPFLFPMCFWVPSGKERKIPSQVARGSSSSPLHLELTWKKSEYRYKTAPKYWRKLDLSCLVGKDIAFKLKQVKRQFSCCYKMP